MVFQTIPDKVLLQKFRDLVWPYRYFLLAALACMVLLSATNGFLALLVQPILDNVFIEKNTTILFSLPLLILAVFGVRGVASFGQNYIMNWIGCKILRELRVRLYKHLLVLDMSFFLAHPAGGLISRIMMDTQLLQNSVANVSAGLFREGLTAIVLVGVLFYRDTGLALVSIIGFPVAGYITYRFGKRIRRLTITQQQLMEQGTSQLEETVSGMRIVKAFGMEPFKRVMFRHWNKRLLKNQLRAVVVQSLTSPSMDLVAGFAICGVVLYGGQRVVDGVTTAGAFFSFLTALFMAYTPIKRLSGLNNQFQKGLAAIRRIFEFLNLTPAIQDVSNPVHLPSVSGDIQFENVSFSYGKDQPHVLNNICLNIPAGMRVALVGRSGSGKTSMVNLIPRFFDVTSGRITVDDVDVRQVAQSKLRKHIAMVTQDVILFNDTVNNNISFGESDRSPTEIQAAAKAANAFDFIQKMPNGFDSVIGERGTKLSGGQRQRVSIARSILKNAPILILDEATSALDTESELAVQDALEHLMKGRTTLVIAHRLSTIQKADLIVVLKDGKIVEQGSHEELLDKGKEYSLLHALQFKNNEL